MNSTPAAFEGAPNNANVAPSRLTYIVLSVMATVPIQRGSASVVVVQPEGPRSSSALGGVDDH